MFQKMKQVRAHIQSSNPSLKEFRFGELKKATKRFSPDLLVGEGGFGKVFLGWVKQNTLAPSKQGVGIPVAVKRLSEESAQGHAEWLTEVNFLGHLAHPNIIRLLGYCRDERERLLVYEYMPNKSFDHLLFYADVAEPLAWGTRLLIMIGVARGLTYLHSANVIYRDVKSSNICLDDNYKAKLGDFGLVKYGPDTGEIHVTTRVMGTNGYVAPEYMLTGRLTTKNDIYGFGVVLLESITGQKAMDVNRSEGVRLLDWAIPLLSDIKKLKKIMDPRLEHNYPRQGALKCAALVLRCVAEKPKDRPSSEEVLQNLEQIYALHS